MTRELLSRPKPLSRRPMVATVVLVVAVFGVVALNFARAAALAGDVNNDGAVNVFDLSILLSDWGTSTAAADLNSDGTVNVFDLSILLSHWGQTATPSLSPSPAQTCGSISQDGVTFTLAKAYPCGTFANGDWWVAPGNGDPAVTVNAMTPASANGQNGWMVNPASRDEDFDSRLGDYNAALQPALPYAASGNQSIVKAVSVGGACGPNTANHDTCLTTAVVLTVLPSVPAGNGAGLFRPPYFGTAKPLYAVSQLQTNLLPSLAPVAGAPTLAQVQARFVRLQLDDTDNWMGRYMHPAQNFTSFSGSMVDNYGADLASDNNDAALRLMLNDSLSAKLPALTSYVQDGIDWLYTVKGGITYPSNGGNLVGRKLPAVFAAVLLGDQSLKDFMKALPNATYGEDGDVYFSSVAGRVLWGRAGCSPGEYDQVRLGGSGSKDCRDPYGYIDGGEEPGMYYQLCCTTGPYQSSSLAARLLPGGKDAWNDQYLFDYIGRWVSSGAWTLPDPYNRFPQDNGINAGGGYYKSAFQQNMWNTYHATVP